MIEQIFNQTKTNMDTVLSRLNEELAKIRTGRASTELLEALKVSYFGTPTPLKQIASISTPSASLIQIQPWDKGTLGSIETAVREADLGYQPTNDGHVVRISLPQMTSEDRAKFVKVTYEKAEAARIALRNLRKEAREKVQALEKASQITEDDRSRAFERVDKLTEELNKQIDQVRAQKEQQITSIQ